MIIFFHDEKKMITSQPNEQPCINEAKLQKEDGYCFFKIHMCRKQCLDFFLDFF